MCFALLDSFEQSNINEFAVFFKVCAFTADLNIIKKFLGQWSLLMLTENGLKQ